MVSTLFSRFKYPKLLGLLLAIALAYILFKNPAVNGFMLEIGSYGYIGVFIAGMLFAFGFTAPFAAGFFLTLNPSNIWIVGLIGGIGALVSDLFIFSFIKFSFEDEFNRLKDTKLLKKMKRLTENNIMKKIKVYILYGFAGILIASPLPDEFGVTLLAGLSAIKLRTLAIISFLLNTLGIIILLLI